MPQNEWYTPAGVIAVAHGVMGSIDLDPFSNEVANQTVEAMQFGGGYGVAWVGNVWLNPPFSRGNMARVVGKVEVENVRCMMLCNFDTSTKWCQDAMRIFDAVGLFNYRLKFSPGLGQKTSSNPRPQALFARGPRSWRDGFESYFSGHGRVLRL